MVQDFGASFSTVKTPQTEAIPGKPMVENSAGGFAFPIDDWKRLERFLILGTEGGTYYTKEKELTKENAACVLRCIKADGPRTVRTIADISIAGRAPKNDAALFALAMCLKLGDNETKKLAADSLPKVARIGTHLFHFAKYLEAFGGWGRGTKRAIANWYTAKTTDDLAYQLVKYQSRDAWAHRDLLRLSHAKVPEIMFGYPEEIVRNNCFLWAGVKYKAQELSATVAMYESLPKIIQGFEAIKGSKTSKEAAKLIEIFKLPRECVPTEMLNHAIVWEALLPHMGLTALIRNLATLTRVGVLAPMSRWNNIIAERITNAEDLKKSRVHPIAVLAALLTYGEGKSARGSSTWEPVREVIDALDKAFYASFGNVEPIGKRVLLALDVSGSMASGEIAGVPNLSPRMATAAMALVTAKTESTYHIMGFGNEFVPIPISPAMRMGDAIRQVSGIPFSATDCSLPMVYALQKKIPVDTFIIYTDNETWSGPIHPSQALHLYRKTMGINAKLVVVAMTATNFTIADPSDGGMLDVCGFDTATPNVISDFAR